MKVLSKRCTVHVMKGDDGQRENSAEFYRVPKNIIYKITLKPSPILP